jgi:hypothetical protein
MKAVKILLLFAACFLCTPLFAQQQTPETYISKFFIEYRSSPATAIDNLYATNVWMSQSQDALTALKTKLNSLTTDVVGNYYGQELINTKQVRGRLKVYSYLLKYDRQPVRFIFKFYKAHDKWMLYGFKFDDDMDAELERAARLDAPDLTPLAKQ